MATRRAPETLLRAPKEPDFQQARARKSYLALIEAATELFSSHGYDEVGTPEIAERAGVSTGTFYRYFEDKQQIYLEVVRSMLAAAYTETLEQLTPAKLVGLARRASITHAIGVLFSHTLSRPRLSLSLSEMMLRDPAVAELRRAYDELSVGKLTELIAAIAPRAVVADPEATAFVIYGSAMQCALSLLRRPLVDRDRALVALTDVIERTVFPG